MHRSLPAIGLAAAVLIAACGGDGEPRAESPPSTTATSVAADTAALEVEVQLSRPYAKGAVHVIRVERPDGAQVFERSLGADRRLVEALGPGDYRVLSFQRECRVACPAGRPPLDLGEPVDVCGSYFAIVAGRRTTARVRLTPQEGCEITLA